MTRITMFWLPVLCAAAITIALIFKPGHHLNAWESFTWVWLVPVWAWAWAWFTATGSANRARRAAVMYRRERDIAAKVATELLREDLERGG